jgi:hypothetical protein
MWPWSRKVGFVVSGLLFALLVGALIVASETSDWPSDRLEPWAFLAAVIVALLPLLLLLLDFAADRRATVGISRFISFDFSAGGAVAGVASQSRTITPNIVGAGVNVADSGREEMRTALESATEVDVVEVDLAAGDAWWPTRLLVLAAGGARRGRPSAISFLAKDAGRDRVFQGWASPADLLEQVLRRDSRLQFVYWYALRKWAGQFALVGANPEWPYWEQVQPNKIGHYAAGPQPAPAAGIVGQATDRVPQALGPEMLLANELAVFEPPEHGITAGDLQSLAGPILHKDTVELTAAAQDQVDAALKADNRYIAVTEDGTYRGLASTDAIMRDLLRSTIAALEGAPPAA